MRKTKDRRGFQRGDYVLYKEQVGPNKGKWVRTMEVLEAQPDKKSYFVKDLSSNSIYLCPKNHFKLKEGYESLTVSEAKTVKLISNIEKLKGILKIPRTQTKEWKTVLFCEEETEDTKKFLTYAQGMIVCIGGVQ